jgi:type IV secretion system protein VirB10
MTTREGVVERLEAPELRHASPIWKWLFIATLLIGGAGVLGLLAVDEMTKGEEKAQAVNEDKRPRLKFRETHFDLPVFEKPNPVVEAVPEPEPAPMVPELPRPETMHDKPVQSFVPPPVPVADDEKSGESDEEKAWRQRIAAPMSGSVPEGTSGEERAGEGRHAPGATMDLTVTKTETSVATRYQDLTFTIPKGAQIGCILNTAIESGQTGMVSCTLPEDIYGADGTVVLLDRGSQAIGEYKSATLTYGKRRIYVVWSQIRTPEGVVIDIDSPGTGPLGRAGLSGHIDNHYWERVGIPMLLSIVSFGSESYLRDALTPESSRYIESIPEDTLSPVLSEMARIKPTLHKHQGELVNIFVARDLDLSSVYELRAAYER